MLNRLGTFAVFITSAVLFLLLAPLGFATIPTSGLVARYDFNGNANDSVGGLNGTVNGATLTSNRFGNGSSAYSFNGTSAYIQMPDNNKFSISTTGKFSVSVWIRPGTLSFPDTEGTGYVYWMGKGTSGQHEWACRMYSAGNTEGRDNRTSFYVFNLSGGLGAGSYVQEPIMTGAWIHFVATVDVAANNMKWYKNGELRDTDTLSGFGITPQNGTAPLRVGTRDFGSYFKGGIDNILIYNRVLSAPEVTQIYNDMTK